MNAPIVQVTPEAVAKLQEIAKDPSHLGKVVRIRPTGIT